MKEIAVQAIKTHSLTKHYNGGKVKALEDFTLEVETGQIYSLLGPNGAGKTTFIKILLGIVNATGGEAAILSRDISDYKIRAQCGYLSENHRFPDFLNARQVLYYYGKMAGVDKTTLNSRIPELLRLVNLQDWEKSKIRKFSKGMLQRLGLAQALINDPQLLFLDEPTDGIDPVGRREIRDLLMKLRQKGKTVFLNSHLLSEVERISDRVAILKNGRLLQEGRVEDFISVKDQYHLKAQVTEPEIENICRNLNINIRPQNGAYLIAVNDPQHLNRLIDELRKTNSIIQAVIPRKISLEDFFIEVIEEKTGPAQ
ncbi:MAG: ABC transporter ATP-binding protein [Calditrichia bacterium]